MTPWSISCGPFASISETDTRFIAVLGLLKKITWSLLTFRKSHSTCHHTVPNIVDTRHKKVSWRLCFTLYYIPSRNSLFLSVINTKTTEELRSRHLVRNTAKRVLSNLLSKHYHMVEIGLNQQIWCFLSIISINDLLDMCGLLFAFSQTLILSHHARKSEYNQECITFTLYTGQPIGHREDVNNNNNSIE